MPSIRYYNQTAPFWDFVANLENEGATHPWSGGQARGASGTTSDTENVSYGWGPWRWGWGPPGGFPFRGPPHHHGPHHRHRGPGEGHEHPPHHRGPPPPPGEGPPPPPGEDVPPPPFEEHPSSSEPQVNEKGENSKAPEQDSDDAPRRGRCGRGPRGHGGPRGWGHRGQCGGGKYGKGPWGVGGGVSFGPFGSVGGQVWNGGQEEDGSSFRPEVDVFDTESAYVVHISLPGGKKEDTNVSWDAEKSELAITGVLHRPGDEEFLKTLAMDERTIGMFERKVRLGSQANPAQVDIDEIGAKLDNGILSITVPKLGKDYVEVKMVDIE